jgi:2-polyprenyl-6-methoxyphenol hydroxylase-like FAD-dependent oxidoreductase
VALAQRGAVVTVLEQAPEIAEVGAGIQISPNGWVVLKALGLAETVAATAPRSTAVRLRDFRRGAEVFAMPLTRAPARAAASAAARPPMPPPITVSGLSSSMRPLSNAEGAPARAPPVFFPAKAPRGQSSRWTFSRRS